MRSRFVAAVGAALIVVGVATPSEAGRPASTEITGVATCQDDGTYLVTWTIENLAGDPVDITAAEVREAIDPTPVTVSPDPIPVAGAGTAQITVPGDTSGQLELDIDFTVGPATGGDGGFVLLAGDCTPRETTTTSTTSSSSTSTSTSTTVATTSTSRPAAAAAVVSARPVYTG